MERCVWVQERGLPDINVIVEKMSYIGTTRFEDTTRCVRYL